MKLSDFIDNLQKLVELHPEFKEAEVVAAKDDEGNGYCPVHFTPSIGHFHKDESEFYNEDDYEEVGIDGLQDCVPAVLIN